MLLSHRSGRLLVSARGRPNLVLVIKHAPTAGSGHLASKNEGRGCSHPLRAPRVELDDTCRDQWERLVDSLGAPGSGELTRSLRGATEIRRDDRNGCEGDLDGDATARRGSQARPVHARTHSGELARRLQGATESPLHDVNVCEGGLGREGTARPRSQVRDHSRSRKRGGESASALQRRSRRRPCWCRRDLARPRVAAAWRTSLARECARVTGPHARVGRRARGAVRAVNRWRILCGGGAGGYGAVSPRAYLTSVIQPTIKQCDSGIELMHA